MCVCLCVDSHIVFSCVCVVHRPLNMIDAAEALGQHQHLLADAAVRSVDPSSHQLEHMPRCMTVMNVLRPVRKLGSVCTLGLLGMQGSEQHSL